VEFIVLTAIVVLVGGAVLLALIDETGRLFERAILRQFGALIAG